jgi:hypothetical protein
MRPRQPPARLPRASAITPFLASATLVILHMRRTTVRQAGAPLGNLQREAPATPSPLRVMVAHLAAGYR